MKNLEDMIRNAGFTCRRCGACCSGGNNEVAVSPDEIERLQKETCLSFEEIAEPYPDWIDADDGSRFTFGWVLRRGADGNCMFLKENRCTVYAVRPHLCRTYPFMLDGDELIVSECPAVGGEPTPDAAETAAALRSRLAADDAEIQASAVQYQKNSMVSGSTFVIDSRGTHCWNKIA